MANTAAEPPASQINRLPPDMTASIQTDNCRFHEDADILKELVFYSDPKYTEEEQQELHKLEELRQLIFGTYELETRTDDDFLIRFLRVRRYNVEAAFRQVKHYESFLDRHENWREVDLNAVENTLGCGLVNVLQHRDSLGRRIIWFRIGNWQTNKVTADQVLQAAGLSSELGILESTTQRAGLICIFDMKDFGLTHLRNISSSFAKRMIFFLSECLPVRIESVHFVNEPGTFSLLFSLYQRFLNDDITHLLQFHGQDLSRLHDCVSPDILPIELGGTQEHDPKRYLALTKVQSIIKELENLNYKIVQNSATESSDGSDYEECNSTSWFA